MSPHWNAFANLPFQVGVASLFRVELRAATGQVKRPYPIFALTHPGLDTPQVGSPVHGFQALMAQLQGIQCKTCCTPGSAVDAPTFQIDSTPTTSNSVHLR